MQTRNLTKVLGNTSNIQKTQWGTRGLKELAAVATASK